MTTPKKTSSSSCRSKELGKMTDLSKLYKKVEKLSERFFHSKKNQSTFVPSAQQQSSAQSTSSGSNDPQMPHQPVMINPPYPVHPGFGTGFPQYPYPVQQQQQQPHYPPSYGWALNSAPAAGIGADTSTSQSSVPSFGALSLDIGAGNETAGSGFDHLVVHHDDDHMQHDYLRPDEQQIVEVRNAQSAKLERVKQRVMDEVGSLNFVINDITELEKYYDSKYPYTLVKDEESTTEKLKERVRKLEQRLKKLRAKCPNGTALPPPRPPPPRSISQESSTGPWTCDRCSKENIPFSYRCKFCNLPSRRFDPAEIEFCGCEYCST
uniref:RanBP2-type domain-containing protein n=1 Tax=Caenorhabditis tropicalis TaxID=1561998 RepID=A0A1I7UEN2_9PELO